MEQMYMKKTKFRSMTLTALVGLIALVLSLAIGALAPASKASAATYRATEIFSAGTGGTVDESEPDANESRFIEFTLKNEGSVHFRRDLALAWFAPTIYDETEDDEEGGVATEQAQDDLSDASASAVKTYLSLLFSFPEINFSELSLVFESAEENYSKKNTSKNSLVFNYDAEQDALTAKVLNAAYHALSDDEKEDAELPEGVSVKKADEYYVTIDEEGCAIGEFAVYVNFELIGKFTNIGGNFMEYLSSASSTPRVPLTFTADELLSGKTEQKVLMKSLNGQSFLLKAGTSSNYVVEDNAAPVLVLNEAVYSYKLGRRWSLTYEAIDVCDSSVTVTRRYAMVGAPDEKGNYPHPYGGDYEALTTSTFFMPTSDSETEDQYVCIYFDLDDGTELTEREKEQRRVYLAWYAVEGAVATLPSQMAYECPNCGYKVNLASYEKLDDDWTCPNPYDAADHGSVKKDEFLICNDPSFACIKVDRTKGGPHYIGIEANAETRENVKSEEADAAAAAYQDAVNAASESLSAGDGAYFYLPSLRGLIESDFADYRNLRFNIYYKTMSMEVGASAKSATSLRYNALRIEVEEQGKYIFKVLASDSASNAMRYYVDGKLVDVAAGNIWDIEEIPTFEFEATYNGATIEEPGEKSLGYRDSTYTLDSFEIVGLSGYKTEYELYRLDLPSEINRPSYSDFVKNPEANFVQYKDYLIKINPYNGSISEDNDLWDKTDNKYHWNPDSSLSFVPQEQTYYVVKLTVTEAQVPGHEATAYQVIDVRNPIEHIQDQTYWIENNIVSVILFSIAAVLLIILVVIAVVRPSEKQIEEVDLEELKGGKKNKKKE